MTPTAAATVPEVVARPARAAVTGAWAVDPCPPEPLVLAGELCLPEGDWPHDARLVLRDVLAVAPRVTATHRATALGLLLPHRHGVVVRASAAWLWTGEERLRPTRVDLAFPASAPALPGRRPAPHRAVSVRRTRWSDAARWVRVAGVGVTDPVTTAAECARLLPAGPARRCLDALTAAAGVELDDVARLLRPRRQAGPAPPGTADALALVRSLA